MQRRTTALTVALGLALVLVSSAAMAQYQLTNLVSNQVGQAKHTDALLVNAWGLAYAPGSPFWISDEGSGWSTLYDASGNKQGLQVTVPSASGQGPGSPTGIVFNGSQDFQIQGWSAIFIFATLDGTISGWAPQVNFNSTIIAVNNPGAVYTGLAVTSNASGNMLFAADNANNKVDMYDANFNWVGSFTDSTVPMGFAPFGIQDIAGLVYVTFASQSGGSGGFVDIYSENGTFLKQLIHGSPLNQPWGIAVAPKNFGTLSNTLLVTNNINKSGKIHGFNAVTGQSVGAVKDTNGKDITIDQLWGIAFGGGGGGQDGATNTLFFSAGPSNNLAGTFGKITVAK
ncbi:MAG TPA: TIGR03118 family protein [Candidatus Dormibacteraeota bacterium]|nr:TIGR03118 family protein [Candidatus Dormibacteraeota bacterium]